MSETDLDSLKATILRDLPDLAGSTFKILPRGWDCVAVDVDDRLICKFPRNANAETALVMQVKLLEVIRPRVSLPVPDMRLHDGPPIFSTHDKLHGEHLPPAEYAQLSESSKQRLGEDLGRFYAQLHAIDQRQLIAAGAQPIRPWRTPNEIRERTLTILPAELRSFAEKTIAAYERLEPDPHGVTYGFFDGHGWNMAFDHARERLNGIYDFGDSGMGPLHQEFIYSNMVSADLTERIVTAYEGESGRKLDRRRIDTLTGAHRLWELGELVDNPDHRKLATESVARWAGVMGSRRH